MSCQDKPTSVTRLLREAKALKPSRRPKKTKEVPALWGSISLATDENAGKQTSNGEITTSALQMSQRTPPSWPRPNRLSHGAEGLRTLCEGGLKIG